MSPAVVTRRRALGAGGAALLLLLGSLWLLRGEDAPPPRSPAGSTTLVAAGDISCDPDGEPVEADESDAGTCRMGATAALVTRLDPDAVAALGDLQYEQGSAEQFAAAYDRTWGAFRGITYPAVGNHEYETPGAAGYFGYFGTRAGDPAKGYYSYRLGSWHVVVLNSNCDQVGGCGRGSPQEAWLRADLAAHPSACTLAYWHHPRFSSGPHGDEDSEVERSAAFWTALDEAGADVVLNGHDHDYERFAPQDAQGRATPTGVRAFVVGTGGKNQTAWGSVKANSEARSNDLFGVLELALRPTGYDWRFVAADDGRVTDRGSGDCH